MISDIGFYLRNEAAIRDCERAYLHDDRDDDFDDYDNDDDYPYDTTEEAYD